MSLILERQSDVNFSESLTDFSPMAVENVRKTLLSDFSMGKEKDHRRIIFYIIFDTNIYNRFK